MEEIRLFISIASNRDWKPHFGISLAHLLSRISQFGIKDSTHHILKSFILRPYTNSSNLSLARQAFVDEMIAGPWTHWLALDDDMSFPIDIVERLIQHDKDVVVTNARGKVDEVLGCLTDMNGQRLDSTGRIGLQEVQSMGGAIFLAKIDCFRNIPRPHFQTIWMEKGQRYMDQDVYFSYLIRQHGARIWCDHAASQLVGHIGNYEYKFPVVNLEKFLVA